MNSFSGLSVDDKFDNDGDLYIGGEYLKSDDVVRLRDHLTALLGGTPTTISTGPSAPPVPRDEALKAAEEMITRLAPATNGRGYTDGTTPLRERLDAILRIADYLTRGGAA
ncbi:hypothetical protein GCM10010168_53470 [Actinoplanes ianthinogenes]|uniref:Uncharacterized protein n=1 Tax=Actinoplanes ianthinogenes TaxID=122358 RepID=A0ABM7LQV0_9ACTN|nr:hypothetical protein [Actinoplanes ianthinogenes]BCJ41655.1 hypothetical protein Aiant_23120 [Actinoplanes ianthinogenes]GGR28630.1 hypothetical protein GCM10010168_53470 [Actinoplanes ianthinogenes]